MKYIFLHGLGQGYQIWNPVLSYLGKKYDVESPDLYEWFSRKQISWLGLYSAFEAYCNNVEGPMVLCGLSLGGMLALQYTLHHPEKVVSLVLIGVQVTMPKLLLKIQNIIFSCMPNSAFKSLGVSKKQIITLTKSMMNLDFCDELEKIRCRTLAIVGTKDKANKKAFLCIREKIQNCAGCMIPGAGHEVNRDSPEVLAETLKMFFES